MPNGFEAIHQFTLDSMITTRPFTYGILELPGRGFIQFEQIEDPDSLEFSLFDYSGTRLFSSFLDKTNLGSVDFAVPMDSGRLMLGWRTTEYKIQVFDQNGIPEGKPIILSNEASHSVESSGDGLVILSVVGGSTSPSRVLFQPYDFAGNPTGESVLVYQSTSYLSASLTSLADGTFLARVQENSADAQIIHLRADGGVLTPAFSIPREASMSPLEGGGLVAVWSEQRSGDALPSIYGQRYDADGNLFGATFRVNSIDTHTSFSPVVQGVAGGGFIVSWAGNGISARIYDAEGTAGAQFAVTPETPERGTPSSPAITSLDNDGILITWVTYDGDKNTGTMHGTLFAATRYGSPVNDVMVGTELSDSFQALGGNDTLEGMWGNDRLDGGSGVDLMKGGEGDDTYLVDNLQDRSVDVVGSGYDTVLSSMTYALEASSEIELLRFASLELTAPLDLTGNEFAQTLIGNAGANALRGGGGNDVVLGNGGNDYLDGGSGSDVLDGGLGSDTMLGGSGDDTYRIEDTSDRAVEGIGQGFDTVITIQSYALEAGSEIESLRFELPRGTAPSDLTGNEFGQLITGNAGNNALRGGGGNDVLLGGDGNDYLDGGSGNDTVEGGLGVDTMLGGTGDDVFLVENASERAVELSGQGNDTVAATLSYTLEAGSEIERVRFASPQGVEHLDLVGNEFDQIIEGNAGNNLLRGADGNDVLYGNDRNDQLEGGNGNDILEGGSGIDTMLGGAGDDSYRIENAADRVSESTAHGYDSAYTTVSFSLESGSEIEALRASDTQSSVSLDLTGNDFGQILSGQNGNNRLYGLGGDDYLEGRGGIDTLDGGSGSDIMRGGLGDDYYFVDSQGDRILEASGEGLDTVFTSSSISIEAGSEVEALRSSDAASNSSLNLWGNEFSQVIAGNAGSNNLFGLGGDDYLEGRGGADTLDGGSGSDILIGGLGDDYFIIESVADRVIERADEGYDTIFTSVSMTLAAELSIEALRATETPGIALMLTGNSIGQILTGNEESNRLFGLGGDDYLEGRGGVDTLDGGSGADVMRGGTGNDYYIVDSTADRVLEGGNEGNDVIFTSVTLGLESGSSIEELRVSDGSSTLSINLWGNELGQILAGNNGENFLSAGEGDDYVEARGGNDRLDGGAGNDVLVGGGGEDTFSFAETGFKDRVVDFVSGVDRIDLRAIDAIIQDPFADTFSWIGGSNFGGVAGQLRQFSEGGTNYLAGDVNGDGRPDFFIELGTASITVNDIFL